MNSHRRFDYIKLRHNLNRSRNAAIDCVRKFINPHVMGLWEDFSFFEPNLTHNSKPEKCGPRNQFYKKNEINKRNMGRHLPKVPNYIINLHFSKIETLYYTSKFALSNGRYESSIKGDIDVLKANGVGGRADALKAVELLQDIIGPSYYETSRGGNGIGFHFTTYIPENSDYYYKECNDGYERLNDFELTLKFRSDLKLCAQIIEKYLKQTCNIERFEIKGTPDAVKYNDKGLCIDIIRGDLGMVPREIIEPHRLEEFSDRLRISIDDLLAICNKLQKQLIKNKVQTSIKTNPDTEINGSVGYKVLDTDFSVLKACEALCVAMDWTQTHAGKKKLKCVNDDDRSVCLFILNILKAQNAPETSVKTIIALWRHVKKLGWTNRSPNTSRIATVRAELINAGMLNGENEYVVPNSISEDGEILAGKACRYEPTEEINVLLSSCSLQSKVTPFFIHSRIRNLKFDGTAERPIRHKSQPPWCEKLAA